jgi:transglutaminase-like putative cysteine protease/uncharacterized protein (DUF58 family)
VKPAGPPRLTVRGRGVLVAAGGLLLAAKLFGSPELAGLGVAAGGAVGVAALLVRRARMTYRAERWLAPSRVSVGEAAQARLRFSNMGRGAVTSPAGAVDDLGREGAAGPAQGGDGPEAGPARCLVPALAPGAMAEARYELPTKRRGALTVGPLTVCVGDPFGLVERRDEVAGTARLVVHPRIHPVLALPGSPTREARQGRTSPARSARGDDFFALREYEVGDDLRRVHWRSTARMGDLMLRQDELRFGEVATVLLDTRAAAHRGDSFERALEVAASVAAALVEDGRRLRFVTTGGFDVELDASRAGSSGGPAEGKWAAVLEQLALVQPDSGGADRFALAVQSIGRDPSGPLAAIVGAASPAELAALGALRSRLGHVMIARGAPEVSEAGEGTAPSAPGAVVVPVGTLKDFAAGWNAAVRGCGRLKGQRPERGRKGLGLSATGGAAGPIGAVSATGCAGGPRADASYGSRPLWALAAISLLAATGCARLFEGAGWVVPALVAVVGAHVVGGLTRRWPVGVAAGAHAAGLLLLLAERVGGHTAYGVPTPATFTALARAAGRAPEALRAAIVPAPTLPELILLVVTGLWVAAAVADGLARRRRAGLLAVLPLAAFPVLVAALGTGRGRIPLTFVFGAGTALYAAVDRAARLPAIEAVLLRPPAPGPARARLGGRFAAPGFLTGSARRYRRVGVAGPAVAVGLAAALFGPVVPGIGQAVVDVHAFGVTLDVSRVELNPLVDIQPQLLTERRMELFTVRSAVPAYWRLTALDRFDGRRWSPSRPALFRQDGLTADGSAAADEALPQDFRLTGLDSPWLPAAGKAIRIQAAGARLDPATDSLVTKKGSRAVRAYRVESRLPPDPAEQRPSAAAATAGPPAAFARYLTLPRGFPGAVRQLAERFTAGATTPYERAAALEDSLRVGFIYDESAPPGVSTSALHNFLFTSRRGYCEQFAGAFAAMARALGLPTRLAVGFTPGTYDESIGVWRVTTREAHAWPEVFLAGLGWTPFEPTPNRVLPDPDDRVRPSNTVERLASSRGSGGADTTALARVDPGGDAGVDAGPGGRAGGLAGVVTDRRTLWWLGAAALGLLAVPPAAKTRRRNTRRRAGPGDAVLAAWCETLDRLGESGLPRRPEETPLEFTGRAASSRPGAAPALRRLALLVNGAAYGPASDECGGEAWAASDRIVRALDAHDPRWVRWRRRLDPRPLLPR